MSRQIRECRFGNLTRSLVLHLTLSSILRDLVERLSAFHRSASNILFRRVFSVPFQLHLREECGNFIILILSPSLEGMIVTLVTIKSRGQE